MSKKKVVLEVKNVGKSFKQGKDRLIVLRNASLKLKEGEAVSLVGPSGSGKTTLLQMAGLLDSVGSGKIYIDGHDCSNINENERTLFRRSNIGFIYQFHHLLPEFSALENVVIPQIINGKMRKDAEDDASEILKFLGLGRRMDHRPAQLSGGEQQRVAIARAIVNKPSLLLADEPTGNLDPDTAENVFQLLLETVRAVGIAFLMVTHNTELASRTDRSLVLKNGSVVVKRKTS